MPPDRPLPPALLAALGLASCVGTTKTGDTGTTSLGPCLDYAPTTEDTATYGPCLQYTTETVTYGPCLDYAPPPTGDTGSGGGSGHTGSPADTATPVDSAETGDTGDAVVVRLDGVHGRDGFPSPSPGLPSPIPAAPAAGPSEAPPLPAVDLGDLLPADVVERLRARGPR